MSVPAPACSPDLGFAVEEATIALDAAVPTIAFRLRVHAADDCDVRAMLLGAQIRIVAPRRGEATATRARLRAVCGDVPPWLSREAPPTLLWTNAVAAVPPFRRSAAIELAAGCTYDFEIAAAKYFYALAGGHVPLEFVFSGTLLWAGAAGTLETSELPYDRSASFELPLAVWRRAMDRHYPGTAWLRLQRDVYDRLFAFKWSNAQPRWDDAIAALLRTAKQAGWNV
jgi:hypothetical protein